MSDENSAEYASDEDNSKLSSLKIKKTTYSFIQRRRFSPVRHFVPKKKPQDPISIIKSQLGLDNPSKNKKNNLITQPSNDKMQLSNDMILLGASIASAFLFIFLLLFVFSYYDTGIAPLSNSDYVDSSADLHTQIFKAGMLTYGSQGDEHSQPYFILDSFGSNIKNISISADLYSTQPPNQVFMLVHRRDGADTYTEFRNKLQTLLVQKGWKISDIRLSDLQTLRGSAVLIVPTGYLPQKLLGSKDGSYPSISDLASRGINVIYIGQAFDLQVMSESGELIASDQQLVDKIGIEFDKSSKLSSHESFGLQSPFYSARDLRSKENLLWGSISVINRPSGTILLIPETLDGGWVGDGSASALDISNLIIQAPYLQPFSSMSFSQNSITNSSINRKTLFFEPSIINSATLRLNFEVYDNSDIKKSFFMDWPIFAEAKGKVYIDSPFITPDYLGGTRKTVVVQLNEPSGGEQKLYFELWANGSSIQQIQVEQGKTNLRSVRSAPIQFSQAPGEYILRVIDANNYVYGATKVDLVGVDIRLTTDQSRPTYSFRDGVFNATFYSNGRRLKVPTVRVFMENQPQAKSQTFTNTDSISYVPSIDFKRGDYTLVFDFGGGYTQNVKLSYALAVNVWERPEVIILAIIGVLVFGVAFYLRRPEKERFALDIPDFPPHSSKKIPLSTARVASVFEQLNKDYHWTTMPLSLEELKMGFRKIFIDGRPIIIGDYNLERILQSLERKGITCSYLGFWALKSWEVSSGFNHKLLCSYRYIRDVFVNNAIRFSKLRGTNSKCDVKALIGRSEYYLHIHTGESSEQEVISRALETANLSHTWFLFENQHELDNFRHRLSTISSYLVLKMNVESKRIRLFTLSEFSKIVKDLKSRYV